MLVERKVMPMCFCTTCSMARAGVVRAGEAAKGAAANDKAAPAGGAKASPSYSGSRADGSGMPPVHHIGIVVKDCERALTKLADSMGYGRAYRFEGIFPDAVLANGETGIALRGAFVWMNNTALEVVEPMDDRSPHYAFLQERGEGLHHLAYWVDSVRREIEAMSRGGAAPRILVDGTGPGNDVPWCYVEGDMVGSTIVELIERNAGSEQFYAEVFSAIGGKIPV